MPNSSRIEVFSDANNLYKRVVPRKRLILGVLAAFVLVVAGNAWWLAATLSRPGLEEELEDNAKASAMRRQALERIEAMTSEIGTGVDRLMEGDGKLRGMIKLDKEASKAAQGIDGDGHARPDQEALLTRMEVQAAFVRALNRPVRLAGADGQSLHGFFANAPTPLGAAPDAWPVKGVLSSEFGVRLSPFAGQEEFHKGVDIMAPAGTPVRAPAPGMVTFAGEDAEGTQAVVLDHGGGYVTTFSHMQRLEVMPGETMPRGAVLGVVGQEGRSTGPHLHYEVRLYGAPVDPKKFLP